MFKITDFKRKEKIELSIDIELEYEDGICVNADETISYQEIAAKIEEAETAEESETEQTEGTPQY